MSLLRLLIIGRPAQEWADALRLVTTLVEIDTARLPSAGIRQFEETPADLIVIADQKGSPRVETLARAIRNRPLGELTPILMLAPLPPEGSVEERLQSLDLLQWLPPETPPEEILLAIEESFDLQLRADSSPPGLTESTTSGEQDQAPLPPDKEDYHGRASYFDGALVLEPLDDLGPTTRSVPRSSIFRGTTTDTSPGALSAEELKRKLKAVRHEDYYAILELRRGAEGQQVREAFHRLQTRFHPSSLPFELVHKFQDELDEILDAFEDAFAVLGDPDLRGPYLRHTVK